MCCTSIHSSTTVVTVVGPAPSHGPTATLELIVESSILNPREERSATRLIHVRMQLGGKHENACLGHPPTDYPLMLLHSLNPMPSGGVGQCLQEEGCHDHVTTGLGPRPVVLVWYRSGTTEMRREDVGNQLRAGSS